jgi:hypothetical protein
MATPQGRWIASAAPRKDDFFFKSVELSWLGLGPTIHPSIFVCIHMRFKKTHPAEKKIRLSSARRFMNDLMHFSKKIPLVSIERTMQLSTLIEARQRLSLRPSWFIIFTKAFAQVTAQCPTLRRAYLLFPHPHLYEVNQTSVMFPIEREVENEPMVLFTRINQPEAMSLPALDKLIKNNKKKPVFKVNSFRRILRLNRLPFPFRRLIWWLGLNVGSFRNKYFGCFGITGMPNLGASSVHVLSPMSSNITFGVFQPDGQVIVKLFWDHRVFDGVMAAKALEALERVLQQEILDELIGLAS